MPNSGYGKTNAVVVDGKTLSDARVARGLRLLDIAEMLGTGKGSVSKWEMGTLVPSEDRIHELVRILKTDSFVRWNPRVKPLKALSKRGGE